MNTEWRRVLHNCHTVVELGCGFGVVLKQLTDRGYRAHGVEIFQPYLDYVPVVAPRATCQHADALDWCRKVQAASWDAVMMIDFLEHIPYDDGSEIIGHAQRIAKHGVVVETPKGFLPAAAEEGFHIATPGVPDMFNPHQEHVCGWEVDELEALGFRCSVRNKCISVTDARRYDRIYATWIR